MAIKLLPEHETLVGTNTIKKPAATGRIKIRPEDQAVLDGKMPPAPVPTPAPVEVPQPSLLQKIKSTVSKGTDFVVDQAQQAYERGKIKEPQFKASVGEGMTPEQEMLAQESIKVGNQADPILDAYADIKLPFIDAGITYNKNKQLPLVTDVVKSLVEAPEKAVRTATEVAGLTKFTDERGGDPMFQTASYGEKATRLADDFLNKGYSYSASVLLGAGLTGFEASGDFLFYSSLLKAGGAKAAGQAAGKITPDEVRTAHEFLGNPKSLAEAEARWRELQKQFHPDKNGGNDTISKQLNNAIAILRREGIPDARYAGIVDNRPTKKVEVKRIGEAPVEVPPPVQAVVPEPVPTSKPVPENKFDKLKEKVDSALPITRRTVTFMDNGTPRIYTKQVGGAWTENLTGAKITSPEMIKQLDLEGEKQFEPVSKIVKQLFEEDGFIRDGGHLSSDQKSVLSKMEELGFAKKETIQNPYSKNKEEWVVWKLTQDGGENITKGNRGFINIVPEDIKATKATAEADGVDLGYNPQTQIKMSDGEIVTRPETIVSRTQLQGLVKALEKEEITLTVDDNKNLIYTEPGAREIVIKAKALGLVTDRLPVGGKVKVTRAALNVKGTAKDTVFRGVDDDGNVVAKEFSQPENLKPATSPTELKQRIEQLNKFAQQQAILRKPGGLSKNFAGVFKRGENLPKQGQVNLQKDVISNDRAYMETLAHELGHALENGLTGKVNKETWKVFGSNITTEEWKIIKKELEAVTRNLVGDDVVNAKPDYYLKNTELLARFFEKHFASPGNLKELAPTAVEFLHKSALENPIIERYLEAVEGTIDKGQLKYNMFFKDMKQTYQDALGKRVGTMAWNDEVRYRAMKERAKLLIEKFVKEKFKDVTDDPALLFQAVESIKVTKNGVPEFGTRDFQYVDDMSEAKALAGEGYKVVRDTEGDPVLEFIDGESKIRIVKDRYTPEEARAIFEQLSPEGKQLVRDFTSARAEAKDYFNREVIKDVNKIEGNIEGWVHRYWDDTPFTPGVTRDKLSTKIASTRKMRKGAEGYVEDLQKAMTKVMTELETEKAYNSFITDYFARISKPIAEGAEPDAGWVEVVGDIKKGGVGTSRENRTSILKDGKMMGVKKTRYQVPAEIYDRFKMIREVAVEASKTARVVNSINRYWKVNILFHPGSAATNFLSGGVQYSSKILTDFYREILTGDIKLPQTRSNLNAMRTVLLPKGWDKAPDWIYGGDMSNFYGQFTNDKAPGAGLTKLDKGVDFYGDRVLKLYGAVERYWKKVIVTAEHGQKLSRLNTVGPEGLELPNEMEKEILDMINNEVDFFAYDYDNVPNALENFNRNPVGGAIKPFLKYPYKYAKQITGMMEAAVDQTLPWYDRMAKIMALGTMVSAYAYYREKKRSEQTTPEVPESAPTSMSTRGRLFVDTDEKGNEIFTRVAKYPFINLTEAGLQLTDGNSAQAAQSVQDLIGGVGPVGDIALALMGYSNEYDKYTPLEVRMGKVAGSFLPGTRILSDIARFFDPYQRKTSTFLQGITSVLPLPANDEATLEKLRGAIKTVDVPIEGDIEDTNEEGSRRTTVTRYVENYKEDILMGLLLGIYQTRINPEEAEAFVERKGKNDEKKQAKEE